MEDRKKTFLLVYSEHLMYKNWDLKRVSRKMHLCPWSLASEPEDGNIPLAEMLAWLPALSLFCAYKCSPGALFIHLFIYLQRIFKKKITGKC